MVFRRKSGKNSVSVFLLRKFKPVKQRNHCAKQIKVSRENDNIGNQDNSSVEALLIILKIPFAFINFLARLIRDHFC